MRRALLVFLLAPALARAQAVTPGTINFAPAAIGASACSSSAPDNLTLTFSLQLVVNGTVTSGSYTVFATTAATTTSNGLPVCPSSAGTVRTVTASANAPQVISVSAATVVSAAGLQCSNTSNPTINVCVHYVADGASGITGSATGTIGLSTQPPSAPYIWLVEPANGALFVHWNPGSGGAASTSYQIVATAGGVSQYSAKINSVSQNVDGRIDGLTNGTAYSVTVIPYSAAGDAGPASAPWPEPAVPVETQGLWDRYKGAGGKEQGGCASGPAGLGALLLAAAGLARLRRRS